MDPVTFYKCLADDTRLRCLLLLVAQGELCVCELTAALQEIQPKISRHLAQLRECGLLLARREGKWMHYRVNPALPAWATTVLQETVAGNGGFLRQETALLDQCCAGPDRSGLCG